MWNIAIDFSFKRGIWTHLNFGINGADFMIKETMKKADFDDERMRIIGKKNYNGAKKMIDYYLITSGNKMIYAFSRQM